jgi:hypothetical protein
VGAALLGQRGLGLGGDRRWPARGAGQRGLAVGGLADGEQAVAQGQRGGGVVGRDGQERAQVRDRVGVALGAGGGRRRRARAASGRRSPLGDPRRPRPSSRRSGRRRGRAVRARAARAASIAARSLASAAARWRPRRSASAPRRVAAGGGDPPRAARCAAAIAAAASARVTSARAAVEVAQLVGATSPPRPTPAARASSVSRAPRASWRATSSRQRPRR